MSEIGELVRDVLADPERPGWPRLRELGLTEVGLPEERGGSGGEAADLAEIVEATAKVGAALPVAEHAVAAWASTHAGTHPSLGTVVLVPELPVDGLRAAVPWGAVASHVVIAPLDGGSCRAVALAEPRTSLDSGVAELSADEIALDIADAVDCGVSGVAVAARLATLRSVAIVGAARGAYRLTRAHVLVRAQFGEPLIRIPAVATALARARVDLLQAEVAADRAVRELDRGETLAAAAVARVVCGEVATRVAATTHQLHGAVGITEEYGLHRLSRLLWALRDVDLPERFWSQWLGRDAATGGERHTWDVLTATRGARR